MRGCLSPATSVAGGRTILVVEKLDETEVIGFNHDDYDTQFAWEFHRHFRGSGDGQSEEWTRAALRAVLDKKGKDAIDALVSAIPPGTPQGSAA